MSRSLVKVLGLYSFMLKLSPRLTFLSLFEVPLMIASEKVYNARHQVCADAGESPGKITPQGLYANLCVLGRGRDFQMLNVLYSKSLFIYFVSVIYIC